MMAFGLYYKTGGASKWLGQWSWTVDSKVKGGEIDWEDYWINSGERYWGREHSGCVGSNGDIIEDN